MSEAGEGLQVGCETGWTMRGVVDVVKAEGGGQGGEGRDVDRGEGGCGLGGDLVSRLGDED